MARAPRKTAVKKSASARRRPALARAAEDAAGRVTGAVATAAGRTQDILEDTVSSGRASVKELGAGAAASSAELERLVRSNPKLAVGVAAGLGLILGLLLGR